MKPRIATVSGVFLRPGVSTNKRLYTPELIAKACARMAARIVDPEAPPLSMLTHHGAGDDSTRIVGRITAVECDSDGAGRWTGELADTTHARDLLALAGGGRTKPYLSGVSIRGRWLGEPTETDGITTASDMEIDGIDFTRSPGVAGAGVERVLAEAAAGPITIYETAEEITMQITEADKTPYGDVTYADPGYQSDGKKRYPLDTKAHVRAAWAFINQANNAGKYSAKQLRQIKGRIKSAAKKFGIDIVAETMGLAADLGEVLEAYVSSNLDNGQGTVSVSGYTDEPAKLAAVHQRVALAAMAALMALDPDQDGDIDVGSSGDADDGNDDDDDAPAGAVFCPACGAALPADAKFCPGCGASVPDSTSTGESHSPKEATVAETTVTETAKPALSAADRSAIAAEVAALLRPGVTETAPAATAATPADATTSAVAPSGTESVKEAIAAALVDVKDALRTQMLQEYGPPPRTGLVRLAEDATPSKPLHEMTSEESAAYRNKIWSAVFPAAVARR